MSSIAEPCMAASLGAPSLLSFACPSILLLILRVRFSRLSRVRRELGHQGPPAPWNDADKIAFAYTDAHPAEYDDVNIHYLEYRAASDGQEAGLYGADGRRIGEAESDRFLDPQVLSGLRDSDTDLAVQEVGRGDADRVDTRVGDHVLPSCAPVREAVERGRGCGTLGPLSGRTQKARSGAAQGARAQERDASESAFI